MSESTRRTLFPVCARTTARFKAVKLLPSPISPLVTRITCGGVPGEESSKEVRKARNASALPELRCSRVTGSVNCRSGRESFLPLRATLGSTPSDGSEQ